MLWENPPRNWELVSLKIPEGLSKNWAISVGLHPSNIRRWPSHFQRRNNRFRTKRNMEEMCNLEVHHRGVANPYGQSVTKINFCHNMYQTSHVINLVLKKTLVSFNPKAPDNVQHIWNHELMRQFTPSIGATHQQRKLARQVKRLSNACTETKLRTCDSFQRRSPPRKIIKLTIIGSFCEILNNFLMFFIFRHIKIFVKWCSGPSKNKKKK